MGMLNNSSLKSRPVLLAIRLFALYHEHLLRENKVEELRSAADLIGTNSAADPAFLEDERAGRYRIARRLTKPLRHELLQKEIAKMTNKNKVEIEAAAPDRMVAESGWNLEELLGRLDDDRGFLCELLRVYRDDSQVNLQKAKSALANQDLGELTRAAHTLKGMLRNLSMNGAAGIAGELEHASKQDKGKEAEELLAKLEKSLMELLPEVDAQLAEVKA
jgi:HPt (histidine-containing phosphotransfer) domain-containing protein